MYTGNGIFRVINGMSQPRRFVLGLKSLSSFNITESPLATAGTSPTMQNSK